MRSTCQVGKHYKIELLISHNNKLTLFGLSGRLADTYGNLAQWWDEETLRKYQLKQECLQKQYSEYPLPQQDNTEVNNF